MVLGGMKVVWKMERTKSGNDQEMGSTPNGLNPAKTHKISTVISFCLVNLPVSIINIY